MQPIETEGPSVSEAVDAALKQSGLRRDQVEVTVIQEGSSGFLGLGSKPARVRLTEKRWGPDSPVPPAAPQAPARRAPVRHAPPRQSAPPPRPVIPAPRPVSRPAPRPETRPAPRPETRSEPRRESRPAQAPRRMESPRPQAAPLSPAEAAEACARAATLLTELLKLMSVAAPTVTSSWDADMERVKAVVESQDASVLVNRDGRVLESLQFLTTLMLSRTGNTPVAVQVDTLSYWEKREQAILDQARRAIAEVMATGKPCRLEPMDASMRRLIHRTYAANPDISTSSEGEGPWRKLVIRPRKV